MAEENEQGASKTEAPTQRRLQEAREQGNIPKSPDVSAFATLAAAGMTVIGAGGMAAQQITERLLPFLQRPDAIDLSGNGGVGVARRAMEAASPVLWVLAAAAGAGVAANVAQQGFVWSTARIGPDLQRFNPLAGLKRVFGLDGLVHFGKSLLKVAALGITAWLILKPRASVLQNLSGMDPSQILPLSMDVFKALLIGVLVVLAVIALADVLWQRQRFTQRLMMSKEEVKEDTKQSEGDPHIKAKLRAQRMRRSKARMIQSVPKATLVVMNPTHYAVALRYVSGETAAPICVAKGLDDLALKMRRVAEEYEIPVVEDPPLARALYATMEVDEVIPREHYEAVARIIGFVMGKSRRRAPPRPVGRNGARPNAGLRPSRL